MKKNFYKGQSMSEYAFVIGIVAVALFMMQVYMRRSIQAVVKVASDELGFQKIDTNSTKRAATESISDSYTHRSVTNQQIGKAFRKDINMTVVTKGTTNFTETETGIEIPGEK